LTTEKGVIGQMKISGPQTIGNLPWEVTKDCEAGHCVMIAKKGDDYFIGDSKAPTGPFLTYTHDEWVNFVNGVKQGDFDRLS
jgi:hypothetical protein